MVPKSQSYISVGTMTFSQNYCKQTEKKFNEMKFNGKYLMGESFKEDILKTNFTKLLKFQ